jgi:hypothetical protein
MGLDQVGEDKGPDELAGAEEAQPAHRRTAQIVALEENRDEEGGCVENEAAGLKTEPQEPRASTTRQRTRSIHTKIALRLSRSAMTPPSC